MKEEDWEKVLGAAEGMEGDLQVIFSTEKGPSALETEWRMNLYECGLKTLRNIWFPYATYGIIEAECENFNIIGTWVLGEKDRLISIKRMDPDIRAILRGMGSNNIESGVLRLFSYEMIPEG